MSNASAPRKVRVLVVEDERDAWLAIQQQLKEIRQFECLPEWVSTYEAAVQALDGNAVDLCLLDSHLGEHEGIELLKHAVRVGCKSPIVLLSGQDSAEVAVAAMQAGASNYLLKQSLSSDSLARVIAVAIPAESGTGARPLPTFLGSGDQLFEYQIEKVLGHGGFGVTYLARDTLLEARVAIKEYLPAELAFRARPAQVAVRTPADHDAFHWGLKQFLKEARTLARFSHPNLVRVLRFFEANATAYIVMEYAQGETFGNVLKREKTLPEERIRAILDSLLSALERVHAENILHRDIKPENVILLADGQPVLIDFGAARVRIGQRTHSTIATFSAGYTPIEQYSSTGEQGPWTDIYALGGMVYRCVSGRRPDDAVDRVRHDAMAPASSVGKGRYSAAFLEAVDWALKVHAADRPQSIAAWRSQFDDKTRGVAVPGWPAGTSIASAITLPPPRQPARNTRVAGTWAIAAVAVLFAAGAALLYGTARDAAAPVGETAVPPLAASPGKDAAPAPAAEAATRSVRQRLKPLAEMNPLSSFRDCPKCPTMRVVPAGAFSMGSQGGSAESWEGPVHAVRLATPYAIGRTEITAEQWAECVSAGGCPAVDARGAPKLPAVRVSWQEAQGYAAWLTALTGRDYRLPSEAAWEYAARAGAALDTFWDGRPEAQCDYANGADTAAKGALGENANIAACEDRYPRLAPVASFKPNAYKLFDMLGNAWEWTQDCWRDSYEDAPNDGSAVFEGNCERRVARGGSWGSSPNILRTTSRAAFKPTHRTDTVGFRVMAN